MFIVNCIIYFHCHFYHVLKETIFHITLLVDVIILYTYYINYNSFPIYTSYHDVMYNKLWYTNIEIEN